MKVVNFGIVKAIVSNKFKDTIVEGVDSSYKKKAINEFVDVLKSSKLLETELTVFTNLESKTISNSNLAIKYIDENISLMKKFTKEEFINEHKKIDKFHDEDVIFLDRKATSITENIHNLISESLDESPDVDLIHESFSNILDHITKDKKESIQESIVSEKESYSDDVIEIAVNKFNSKFSKLSESEQSLMKTLAFASDDEKKELFESLKINCLKKLQAIKGKTTYEDVTNRSISKINEMVFNKETVIYDLIQLNNVNMLKD